MTAPSAAQSVSRITRSFAGLAVGEAAARALAFVATLVVARRLGPAMYGIIGVASGILLYCQQVADAGIELSGVPAIARQQDRAGEIASATLAFRLVAAVVLMALVALIGLVLLPQPDGAILAIYALSLVSTAASARWVLIGFQRPMGVAVARVSGELVALALVVLALREAGDLAIVPVATVAGLGLSSLMMLVGVRRLGVVLRWNPDWEVCRPLFMRAPHLVGFTLLGLLLFNFDLIYIRFASGAAPAGFYAAAYTFIAFTANLTVAWAHSVMPALAQLRERPAERGEVYATTVALGVAVTLPAAVGGILVAHPLILFVFGTGFGPAATALQWLLPAIPLAAVREVAVAALIGMPGGERELLRVNGISAAFNILVLLPVVPAFGLTGAAAVTVVTEALRLYLLTRFTRRAGFGTVRLSRYQRPVLATVAMVVGIRLAGATSLFALVGLGGAIYAAVLLATGALHLERGRFPRLRV